MSETDLDLAQFAGGCAWISGEWFPIAQARIPILDSGFVRSDCTYDVAAVWKGSFFRLDDHLDRFEQGCRRSRFELPLTRVEIREIMIEAVRRSGLRDAYVEVIVTRGTPQPGERDPRLWTPNLYVFAIPYVWIVDPEQQKVGTSLVISRNVQRTPPNAIDPTVKNFQWGDLVRGLYEAYDRDARFAVHLDSHGIVTEGAGFNVFAVIDGVLRTASRGVLLGITRRTVLEIAASLGIRCAVGDISADELRAATEIFMASTAGGVMPVATLDGLAVGDICPGQVTTVIRDQYWELHADPAHAEPVPYP